MWNYTDTVPFTNGVLSWRIEVVPINGGGTTSDAEFERAFFAIPYSIGLLVSVAAYDHSSILNSNNSGSDNGPTVAPDIEAMVVKWVNDYDFNGMPSQMNISVFRCVTAK